MKQDTTAVQIQDRTQAALDQMDAQIPSPKNPYTLMVEAKNELRQLVLENEIDYPRFFTMRVQYVVNKQIVDEHREALAAAAEKEAAAKVQAATDLYEVAQQMTKQQLMDSLGMTTTRHTKHELERQYVSLGGSKPDFSDIIDGEYVAGGATQ